jgi:hypothetical protein
VLLPVCRLHHFCDAGPARPAQQCEHALLLRSGDRSGLLCLLRRSTTGFSAFGGISSASMFAAFDPADRGGFLGLAARDGALRRDGAFGLTLPILGAALSRLLAFSMEESAWLGLLRFAAPKLTLARPKAPQIAGQALIAPAGR